MKKNKEIWICYDNDPNVVIKKFSNRMEASLYSREHLLRYKCVSH